MSPGLFEVEDLRVETHSGLELLRGLSFDLHRGKVLALVGESGSGKSLTSLALCGLLDEGLSSRAKRFAYGGREILAQSEKAWCRMRGAEMAIVFQDSMTALNPHYRVGRQLAETLRLKLGLKGRAIKERAVELLAECGLKEASRVYASFPHELSGGMRQRVMIALALALDPKVLIADEPTTALDVRTQQQILELFRRLARERHCALLFVSHDLGVVRNLADEIAVVYAGRIVEKGAAELLLSKPCHPYTQALLRARPSLSGEKRSLVPIPGIPPSLGEDGGGCAFAPRCAEKRADCENNRPSLGILTDGRSCACLLRENGS